MHPRHTLARLAVAAALSVGCEASTTPFASGPAYASVTGQVTTSGNTPITAATVTISCAGSATVQATTDSTGYYLAILTTGAAPFSGSYGKVACHFAEPADTSARAQVDTALGFVRGGALAALQIVDLHEM